MLDHDGDSVSGGLRAGDGGHVDEGTVHAWLDGQLSSDEAARIAAHVEVCAGCSAVVAEARGHIAAATRILNALDGVPARVVPRATRRISRWHLRAAAAIIVVAVGTAVVLRGPGGALRSMYEVRAVPATHVPEAPAAQQTVPAPSPTTDGALRAAAPVATPVPKQKSMSEGGLPHAPAPPALAPPALAPKARRESRIVIQASPRADGASGAAMKRPSVVSDEASPAAPGPDTVGVPAPTIENAVQGKAPAPAVPQDAQVATDHVRALAARTADAANRVANTHAAVATRMDAMPDTVVRHITGRVVEADAGKPIPAASIVVSGTTVGSNTTDSGSFALALPPGAKVLTARRIGYLAQTVPLTPGATDYTIPMKKDVLRLETQVVTGVATTTSAQNAANAVQMLLDSSGGRGAAGGAVVAGASRCRDQVVQVPPSGAGLTDSLAVRLTGVPSIDAEHPGLVVRPVPDTVGAEFGRWQPIGGDSALISLTGASGTIPRRVACGNR